MEKIVFKFFQASSGSMQVESNDNTNTQFDGSENKR